MSRDLVRALEFEISLAGPIAYPPQERRPNIDPPSMNVSDVAESIVHDDPVIASLHAAIPAGSPLLAMTSLLEVEEYVASNEFIAIDRERTNPVFGVGNPQADVMVIGEAPGADEDAQGEPFVGRAGQLLNDILKAVQFDRKEVYIANILKSRPPNNRNPLSDEIAAHEPILLKQIALIKPRIILCVGKVAGSTLLREPASTSLTSMRQRPHDFHGIPMYVTYHPAALLRNPNWKRPAWEDVQLFHAHYKELIAAA
jgi:uracil-DNA glycosylase